VRRSAARAGGLARVALRRHGGGGTPVIKGVVESFERRSISGWIDAEPGIEAIQVDLCVNDVPVTTTTALPGEGRRAYGSLLRFRFSLTDIWKFTSPKDRVSVHVANQPIPIAGKGTFYRPRKEGGESLASLRKRLASGYVFGQSGRLQLSKSVDTEWQAAVLGLYQRANKILEDKFGISAFIYYGTLLGAVRDDGFIGHDVDFDCAYVSTKHTGAGAAEELASIALTFMDHGFNVVPKRTCIAVSDDLSEGEKVDIFHLYVDGSGRLCFPFGIAGDPETQKFSFAGTESATLAGHDVLVPKNAEAMVALTYGTGWRKPNPGFKWTNDRTVSARDGIVSVDQVDEVARANIDTFEDATTAPTGDLTDGKRPRVVVEVGSNLGRRSVAIAAAGKQVIGLERSAMTNQRAEALAERHGLRPQVQFRTVEINDPEQLATAIEKIRLEVEDANLTIFVRSLVPFSDRALRSVVTVLGSQGKQGDYLFAAFSPAPSGQWPKDKSADPTPIWTLSDLHEELTKSPIWTIEATTPSHDGAGDQPGDRLGLLIAKHE